MKTSLFLAAAFSLASDVCAQLYAPKTESHDPAQAVFPVEAARVLAWQRNSAADAKIAEVTFEVETKAGRDTVWKLRWLDEARKPLREKTVRYPETLLGEGTKYYREVFKQIAGEDWAIESAPPDNAASAFWRGAEEGGVARLEALDAAAKLLAEKSKIIRPADAARLAGTLTQGALPSVAAARSLDSVLLARAAAWLCTAEELAREPLEGAWAPILILSGHEATASALWARLPAKPPEKRKAPERFWDLALREPGAKDCFLFAARPENRSFALAAMFRARAFGGESAELSTQLANELLGSELPSRLYDYGPGLTGSTTAWVKRLPESAMAAWLAALRSFKPAPFDLAVDRAALAYDRNASPAWLKLVSDERGGKLVPVAHVTTRDLLAFGWENAQPPRARAAPTGLPLAEAEELAELVRAQKKEIANASAAASGDPAAFKSADEFWTHLESTRERSAQRDRTSAAVAESMNAWLKAATAFIKAYPQDPRRWEAKVIAMTIQMQLAQFPGGNPAGAMPDAKEIAAILEAPDATAAAKGEAAYLSVMLKGREVQPNAPHTFVPFHQAADDFLTNYAMHPRALEVAGLQMQLLELRNQPGADNLLKKLAAHPNKQIAETAKERLARRERMTKLRSEPLELKVPTTDGKEIDFAKLRGKVVLLDFWASWCGPCMAELPSVVKTYDALHGQGFEIVGVSLDENREAMDRALAQHKATWPQHFHGTGWRTPLAQQFGVRSIPSAWLFDKKGLLRETDLRGEELQAAVEKLLRE